MFLSSQYSCFLPFLIYAYNSENADIGKKQLRSSVYKFSRDNYEDVHRYKVVKLMEYILLQYWIHIYVSPIFNDWVLNATHVAYCE